MSLKSDVDGNKTFEPMKMVADRTDEGYAMAEKHFNEFALENKYSKLDDLTKTQMLGQVKDAPDLKLILSEFCSYVLDYKKDDNTHIGSGMQQQYLSGIMNFVKRKFPEIWKS
jgi:hypothetical protein